MKKNLIDYLDAVNAFSIAKKEPEWMYNLRQAALKKVDALDLRRIERVRYDHWPLFNIDEKSLARQQEITNNLSTLDNKKEGPVLVQQGDKVIFEQLPQDLVDKGVIFTDIFTAMQQYPELVKKYYMTKAVSVEEDKITAAHAAFMNGGLFLYVPKNVVIPQPIEAVFYHNSDLPSHFFKHVLIVAEENSEFSYLERFISEGSSAKNVSANVMVEVIAKDEAKIKFAGIDQLGENLSCYIKRRGYLLRNASIDWAIGVMNEGDVIGDFDSELEGEGSHAETNVVAISALNQKQAIDTRVTNKASHSIGHILQHGVIRDRATLTFNGIGQILKGAKGADAQQESRVLMLSSKARGDANPILLIDENEVTAGHAASVGRVDPEQMYYLMSRGLPKKEAERLVIRGFLSTVLSFIPIKEVEEELVNVIERKLQA
ncbi:Fe-S cluster assembly protein SufD [Tetragenococcus solitarius]|uniref:Fe-S cluster assembly protein SufD n=1 Tax=Tetragenococcus solitarius TaxID=71453 RepID=A0ABP6KJK5_9ENTE|nr:Fe-S cluster assembly protein SufD [Tetragenococcus solitarius]